MGNLVMLPGAGGLKEAIFLHGRSLTVSTVSAKLAASRSPHILGFSVSINLQTRAVTRECLGPGRLRRNVTVGPPLPLINPKAPL